MLVYVIRNSVNEKVYVGCTRQTLKLRWTQHKSMRFKEPKKQNKLYHAFKKIGFENDRKRGRKIHTGKGICL